MATCMVAAPHLCHAPLPSRTDVDVEPQHRVPAPSHPLVLLPARPRARSSPLQSMRPPWLCRAPAVVAFSPLRPFLRLTTTTSTFTVACRTSSACSPDPTIVGGHYHRAAPCRAAAAHGPVLSGHPAWVASLHGCAWASLLPSASTPSPKITSSSAFSTPKPCQGP
jgi:hypothetical protein